jgi:arylsulfatase A-like enzyme
MPRFVPEELARMPAYYQEAYSPGATSLLQKYWGLPDNAEQGLLIQTKDLNEESIRLAIAHTYGMVTMIDDGIGRIVEALQRRGLAEDTIIVFTSDHGELLGDHGLMHKGPPPYRQLREVPFIIKGPRVPGGKINSDLTSHIDLMPTLLDMANVDMENGRFDGHTLRPLFDKQGDCQREAIYLEYHPRSKASELYNQTIQTKKWRLTIYPQNSDWGELFDLEQDPFEHKNLFCDLKYKTVVQKLKQNLNRHFPPQPNIDNERLGKW